MQYEVHLLPEFPGKQKGILYTRLKRRPAPAAYAYKEYNAEEAACRNNQLFEKWD